jgi:hypothetical protein
MVSGPHSSPPTRLAADMIPCLLHCVGINTVAEGVLRGAGRPDVMATVKIVAFDLIGLPLAYVLGIVYGYQLDGLWIGMTMAFVSQFIFVLWAMYRLDWPRECVAAALRLAEEEEEAEEVVDSCSDTEQQKH